MMADFNGVYKTPSQQPLDFGLVVTECAGRLVLPPHLGGGREGEGELSPSLCVVC